MAKAIHYDTAMIKLRNAWERGTGTTLTPDEAFALGEKLSNYFVEYEDMRSTRAASAQQGEG